MFSAFVFWGLSLILGNCIERRNFSSRSLKKWFVFSALFINTLLLIVLLHINFGLLQKPNQSFFSSIGVVTPENDPSTELIDIQQLRSQLKSSPAFMEALENNDFIFTNQYFLGGYIGMAIAPITDLPLTCFGYDRRGFDFWYPQEELIGKRGIYITSKTFATDDYSDHDYSEYFSNWRSIGEISLQRSGEITETFYLYQGDNLSQIPIFEFDMS